MSAKLKEQYGRTRFHLATLELLLSPVNILPHGTDEQIIKGYNAQRQTAIKDLLGKIFRKSTKGQIVRIYKYPCRVHTPTGSLTIPPGILDVLYFGTFPYSTSVEILTPHGVTPCYNVGNPDFT